MNRTQWTLGSALVAATLGLALLVPSCAPNAKAPGDAAAPVDSLAAKLALGQKLVDFGGCNDCHTPGGLAGMPDLERKLAGSEIGWVGPWGTSYASNLTPDVETGLGALSEEQLVTLMRTGQRADGTPLLPPMPWPNFAFLDDAEMRAIAAYLKSVPAVKHARPANLPPGQVASGPTIAFPEPGAWDAPKGSPEGAPPGAH